MPRRRSSRRPAPPGVMGRPALAPPPALPPVDLARQAARAGQEVPVFLQNLLSALHQGPVRTEEMFCFILYDIEDNKVRRLVAKYLEKKGCLRVQKSVFFARLHRRQYQEVAGTLREIQQAYENQDSVLLLPVGEDQLNQLVCVGKEFEFELMTRPHTTLFI